MEYEYRETAYDLTQEERDKAAFILKACDDANIRGGRQSGTLNRLELAALNEFKQGFYREVRTRLNLTPWPFFPVLDISDDGTKVIQYQVVTKKEEKEVK